MTRRLLALALALLLPTAAGAQDYYKGNVNAASLAGSITLDTTSGNAFRRLMSPPAAPVMTENQSGTDIAAGVYQTALVGVDLAAGTSLPSATQAVTVGAGGAGRIVFTYADPIGSLSLRAYVSLAAGTVPDRYFVCTASPCNVNTLTGATVAALPTVNTAYRFNLGGESANWWSLPMTYVVGGLGTTSTTGLALQNATTATAAATVQISPRFLQAGYGWDVDDAVSRPVSFFPEVLPVSGNTVTGTWKLGFIDPVSGALTYPLAVASSGILTLISHLQLANSRAVIFGAHGHFYDPNADGQFNFTNAAETAGIGLDVALDGRVVVRNRAQTADAQIQASDALVTGQVLARESFDQPHFMRKVTATTFGAKGQADGDEMMVFGSPSGVVQYREEQTKTVSSWVDVSGGLNLDGENVDEDGVDIALGDAQAGAAGWLITGGSPTTCFTASVTVGDNAGTDQLFIGWRAAGAFSTTGLIADYSEYAGIGINNVDGSIFAQHEINTTATSDDTTVNWGDAETRLLKSCITATTRVPTAYYTAAGGTSFTQVTLTNSGGAQTTGVAMFPFVAFLKETTTDGNFFINYWEITR